MATRPVVHRHGLGDVGERCFCGCGNGGAALVLGALMTDGAVSPPPETPLVPLPLGDLPPAPTTSVAIICFNYARFLGECLDSCLAQTLPPDQIVVVNDGSTDNTAQELDNHAARCPRILAIHQTNGGICAATNAALAACSGDVVFLLDADDVMAPTRIAKVIAALRERVDGQWPGWAHHPVLRFGEGKPDLGISPHYATGTGPQGWLAPAALRAASSPVLALSSALAFRREVLRAIGPLDGDRLMYQDLQLCTAATLLSPAAWLPEPLTLYRVHGTAATAGSMVSLQQISATRLRAERFDAWLRTRLDQRQSGAAALWRPVTAQGGFLWLTFVEKWLSGGGKDRKLLRRVLRHGDTRAAPLQQ
ncbi:MAG: glycosyltransferase family 2 protein, partial [Comamonadaceae bacterium]